METDKSQPHVSQTASSTSIDNETEIGAQDAREMANLGLKQQLRRNFRFFSILGFSCICMITWEGELVVFLYGLQNGGPAGLVIGFIVVWVGYAMVVASMAELMSMWPTSAGQYFWAYTLSTPRWGPFLSYICGWQTVIAWQSAVATACYLTGTMIQGLAILNYPAYVPKLWHGTLLTYAILAIVLLFNTILAKWLPHVEAAALWLHLVGFVTVVVVITVMSPHKATAHEVFGVFINDGGWSSQGVSFLVGLQGVVFAFLGADSAIHMSEETANASTVVPQSLLGSIAINGVLGLGVLLVVLFYGGNLAQSVLSPTGYPIEAIFTTATGSRAGGTGLTCILIAALIFACITVAAAGSRELWAFARDDGLPGARFLKRVEPRSKLPLRAIWTTALITLLLALISIGSAVPFNALISLTVAGYVGSYLLPLPLLLHRRLSTSLGRRQYNLPWGPFRMGPILGPIINALAICWCVLVIFWSFWPHTVDPGVVNMNWSCVAYGASTILAGAFWLLDGRKRYRGPVRDASGGVMGTVVKNCADGGVMTEV